jgi:TonB family protein
MRRSDVVLSAALSAALFAGSTWYARAAEPAAEAVAAAATTMSPRSGPAFEVSTGATMDAYKRHFAERVTQHGKDELADSLPVILKGVIVLDVTIDHEGKVTALKVWRSNGYKDLEQTALTSVRKVGRFPAPSADVLNGSGSVRFLETWLFRPDGRYQVRSMQPKEWKPTLPVETQTAKK